MCIKEGDKIKLSIAVWNDSLFLDSLGVMDYSLLVGLDKDKSELVVGIIGTHDTHDTHDTRTNTRVVRLYAQVHAGQADGGVDEVLGAHGRTGQTAHNFAARPVQVALQGCHVALLHHGTLAPHTHDTQHTTHSRNGTHGF